MIYARTRWWISVVLTAVAGSYVVLGIVKPGVSEQYWAAFALVVFALSVFNLILSDL